MENIAGSLENSAKEESLFESRSFLLEVMVRVRVRVRVRVNVRIRVRVKVRVRVRVKVRILFTQSDRHQRSSLNSSICAFT